MQHPAAVAPEAKSTPVDPVYLIRDNLFREYQPATEAEKMLVTHIAQAWVRLQRAQDAETRLFAETDILTLLKTDRDAFKTLSRYLVDCERAWRRALEELHRLQRQRLGPQHRRELSSPRSRQASPARAAMARNSDSSAPASTTFNATNNKPARGEPGGP